MNISDWVESFTVLADTGAFLDELNVEPTLSGLPGAALIDRMLGWLQALAIAAGLGAVLAGFVKTSAAKKRGSGELLGEGQSWIVAGCISAVGAGIAVELIQAFLF